MVAAAERGAQAEEQVALQPNGQTDKQTNSRTELKMCNQQGFMGTYCTGRREPGLCVIKRTSD